MLWTRLFFASLLCATLGAAELEPKEAVPPPMREVAPGIFELGGVRIDQGLRTVSFPCEVNMAEGDAEYAIVGTNGKTHESLLRTKIEPYSIHLAMLLLGSKTASAKKSEGAATERPPSAIDAEYLARAPKLTGDDLQIEVAYEFAGKKVRRPLEELIWDARAEKPMSRGRWLYNGSLFYEGKFCAQVDESVAAVIDDPCALINNPREGEESAAIWVVRPGEVPAEGTAVTVTLKLTPASEKTAQPNSPIQ